MTPEAAAERMLLRHILATPAYRCAKTLRGAPADFATWKPGPITRTPIEVLAHIGDLMDWVLATAQGTPKWNESEPLPWEQQCTRFFAALGKLDRFVASEEALAYPAGRLFQGGIADALTHTGQLAMLRRMHGSPMKGESYFRADIVVGRTGPEQTPADSKYEFD